MVERPTLPNTFFDFLATNDDYNPVVLNDPILLFSKAGMGIVDSSSSPIHWCNTQSWIHSFDKHYHWNDLGKETCDFRISVLDNMSVGKCLKLRAISLAWNVLTQVYNLPADQLHATYFDGDDIAGLQPDEEARDIWLKFLPRERLLACKDNIWKTGDTGPCGSCTVIYYNTVVSSLVNNDDPTCVEVCKLVFEQSNREADQSLKPLHAIKVRTGMSFERLTSVLQNDMSYYDTDLFKSIFEAIELVTEQRPYSGKFGIEDVDSVDMGYRVVADHIRTLCFAIADGSHPGDMGREYILRRIFHRADCYGLLFLRSPAKFLNRLVEPVVKAMSDAFPELKLNDVRIKNIIYKEASLEEPKIKRRGSGAIVMNAEVASTLQEKGVAPTDDSYKLGWVQDHQSTIKAIYTGSKFLETATADIAVGIVLESTSFYAAQGGQLCDLGMIEGGLGTFLVCYVQTLEGYILHIGCLSGASSFSVGDEVSCKVAYYRREIIAPILSANSYKQKILDASILEGRSLEEVKRDVRSELQKIAMDNKKKAVEVAIKKAETADSNGSLFCIFALDVGLDAGAVREAVLKFLDQKGIPCMVYSVDETTNKVLVCAGVTEKQQTTKFNAYNWLKKAFAPLREKRGYIDGDLAHGMATGVLFVVRL